MKAVILYADGFEDVEAVATRDVLVRAGIDVLDAKINEDSQIVVSSHKMSLTGFLEVKNVDINECDILILPGGSRGVQNLLASEEVDCLVRNFYLAGKWVCAICAAPMVLAKNGLLIDRDYTCYPGCNEGLDGNYTGDREHISRKLVYLLFSVIFRGELCPVSKLFKEIVNIGILFKSIR